VRGGKVKALFLRISYGMRMIDRIRSVGKEVAAARSRRRKGGGIRRRGNKNL
jgi:hypothetical protein